MNGTLKPLLELDGESLIERQIRTMRELCGEIIVVTDAPQPFLKILDPEIRIITDFFAGRGALGGMHSALRLARNPLVWFAACDMPFLSADVARRMERFRTPACQAVIPLLGGRPVPLHGMYDKQCAEAAAKLLAKGDGVTEDFLGMIRWLGMEAEEDPAENGEEPADFSYRIITGDDYVKARQILRRNALRMIGS